MGGGAAAILRNIGDTYGMAVHMGTRSRPNEARMSGEVHDNPSCTAVRVTFHGVGFVRWTTSSLRFARGAFLHG